MFMSEISQKINDSAKDWEKIRESLDIPKKKKRLEVLVGESSAPTFWDDNENATKVMSELGDIKKEIEEVEDVSEVLSTLLSLSKEEDSDSLSKEFSEVSKRISKLKLAAFLNGEFDKKNAIVGIHAGQGGVEAMDWANMLFRMYMRFCERRGWKYEIIDISEGEEAGIKGVTFKVLGNYAYGYFKREGGTHRLVRQSPFNADKLRQTSFALVEILPELAEFDLPEIKINPDELEWQFFRAGSQGGQNVQKVSTAVRLIHKPTGIVVTAQTERYQEQNRKYALELLRARLWAKRQEDVQKEKTNLKGDYKPASWGAQIRSYVLHPYKMVKDLRTEVEVSNPDKVLDGELDEFVEAEIMTL
jgi:peptide chain release factor 2